MGVSLLGSGAGRLKGLRAIEACQGDRQCLSEYILKLELENEELRRTAFYSREATALPATDEHKRLEVACPEAPQGPCVAKQEPEEPLGLYPTLTIREHTGRRRRAWVPSFVKSMWPPWDLLAGQGTGDHCSREVVANVATSIPFLIVGATTPRIRKNAGTFCNSVMGVGLASSLYHMSRGKHRKPARWMDHVAIATSTACLTRALYPHSPATMVATIVSAAFLPFQPLAVASANTILLEVPVTCTFQEGLWLFFRPLHMVKQVFSCTRMSLVWQCVEYSRLSRASPPAALFARHKQVATKVTLGMCVQLLDVWKHGMANVMTDYLDHSSGFPVAGISS
eukprot:jgi/Mesvir1/20100/Mv13341-RA.1